MHEITSEKTKILLNQLYLPTFSLDANECILPRRKEKKQVGAEMMHLSGYFHTVVKKKNFLCLKSSCECKNASFSIFISIFITPYLCISFKKRRSISYISPNQTKKAPLSWHDGKSDKL